MVNFRKLVICACLLAIPTSASSQTTNNENPPSQWLSSLQSVDFQQVGAAFTAGFQKHATALKKSSEAIYAQVPPGIRDNVEKVHKQVLETITSPEAMQFKNSLPGGPLVSWTPLRNMVQRSKRLQKQAIHNFRLNSVMRSKAHAKIYEIGWNDLSADIQDYIREHPYQTAFHVVNGIVFFAPAKSSGPILWALGFANKGPRAASFASMLHSKFGVVGAKSMFAYLQSAGMGGYGLDAVNIAARLSSAAGIVGGLLGREVAAKNGTSKL